MKDLITVGCDVQKKRIKTPARNIDEFHSFFEGSEAKGRRKYVPVLEEVCFKMALELQLTKQETMQISQPLSSSVSPELDLRIITPRDRSAWSDLYDEKKKRYKKATAEVSI